MKYIVLSISIVLFSLVACKKNHFKKSEFLQSFYTNKIAPDFLVAETRLADLEANWTSHALSPSAASLADAQSEFILCLTTFEQIAFYNLGDINAINVYNAAYKTSVDTAEIWNNYSANSVFTTDLVSSYGNQEKGIFTIEYLLFSDYADDSVTVSKYISFVSAQIDLLLENFALIKNSWATYETNFTKNDDEGVEGSYNIVINRIIHLLEDIIDKRINKPLDAADLNLAVGHWSETSWTNIKTHVAQVNDIYLGDATTPFNSIYNSVRKKNKKLAEDIKEKFAAVVELGNGMTQDMNYYITTGSAELISYKEKLKEILVLFKLDVVKELEIVLTFGDNDGD